MKKSYLLLLAFLIIAGCSSTKNTVESTKSNTENSTETTAESEVDVEAKTASEHWHHESGENNSFLGIGTDKAYSELLSSKSPSKKVIVAIIDSGTDIEHEDLSGNIWVNKDEIAGNGLDDDENGYVDDVHGWNFIGGKNGENVNHDTYELTRIYVDLKKQYEDKKASELTGEKLEEFRHYLEIKKEFEKERAEAKASYDNIKQVKQAVDGAKNIFNVTSIDSVSDKELELKSNDGPYRKQAKQIIKYFRDLDVKESDIDEAYKQFDKMYNYAYNPEFNPRYIVGDNFDDLENRYYGNNDVEGPRSDHGSHVAGIVGAVRNNELGMNGIAGNVSLMIVRAVPDGDERDKDVGNAIRYAVENGADIINMSFGKSFSPRKFYVDEALRFADDNNVLVINAAGNSGENIDSTINFPNKFYTDGGMMKNFITVGASSWEGDSLIAAQFSNYGENVDLFAPGVDVYSTTPDNTYKANDGTSMASPVVAGAAALIMSYYPTLTASEVKMILLQSVSPIERIVYRPGSDVAVPFSSLSSTGGILNVYKALMLAEMKTSGTN
ncbi:MAG: S8 family peptidase [Balneola sp.]